MKFLRYGELGFEKPAILDNKGVAYDISQIVNDISIAELTPSVLQKLSNIDFSQLVAIPANARIGACLGYIGKFIGIGLNYRDHVTETKSALPREPFVFAKFNSSICGANDPLRIPKNSKSTDYEVELGFVIGKEGLNIDLKDASSHIFGYFLALDFSERHFQKNMGGEFLKGKSYPSFGPIGPWLATADEIADPNNLKLSLELDGAKRQDGNTKDMLFNCTFLVHYLSQFFPLLPGDIVITGTPAGVGAGMNPPSFIKQGNVITASIPGLGEQRHLAQQD